MLGHLDALAVAIDGEVVRPDSPMYNELAAPWNAKFDGLRPQALVRCRTSGDVVETLSAVRGLGVDVAVRCGGHSFAAHSSTDGIVIDVGPMNSVRISDELAIVGGGATLQMVYRALLSHGLTIPGGSCPSVGIAGFTLGGGIGILGRKYGLASDRLVGARVVLADGRVVDCAEALEPDLFWALRGGGIIGLGVVTELRFEPIAAPDVAIFELRWPADGAAEVIDAWQHWAPDTPDEVAPSVVLGTPVDPDEPGTVEVFGTVVGGRADTEDLIDGFLARITAKPTFTDVSAGPYLDALEHWAHRARESIVDDLPPPVRGHHEIKSEFFARPLPRPALDDLVTHLAGERVPGQARELDFTAWGGAYVRPRGDAAAFVHRRARFLLKHAASNDARASSEERRAARAWTRRSWELADEWGTGGVFPNFADADLARWDSAYFGANDYRLRSVKARYDPDGVFGGAPRDR